MGHWVTAPELRSSLRSPLLVAGGRTFTLVAFHCSIYHVVMFSRAVLRCLDASSVPGEWRHSAHGFLGDSAPPLQSNLAETSQVWQKKLFPQRRSSWTPPNVSQCFLRIKLAAVQWGLLINLPCWVFRRRLHWWLLMESTVLGCTAPLSRLDESYWILFWRYFGCRTDS